MSESRDEATDAGPTMPDKLRDATDALPDHWQVSSECLKTTYLFASFGDAIRFMAACIDEIDRMDHHPDWSNAHRRVHVTLTTHTTGCVTEKDLKLAAVLDELYSRDETTRSFG